MVPKITLLYTGPRSNTQYSAYTNAQLNSLVGGGSTDFLILTADPINRINSAGKTILTNSDVDNLPSSYFVKDIAKIKATMKQEIATYNGYTNCTIENFVAAAMTLANRILAINSNKRIWIGLPRFLPSAQPAALQYVASYKQYIISAVKSACVDINSSTQYKNVRWTSIAGFYFGQEGLDSYYTPFNTSVPGSNFNNPVVMCMKSCSDYVRTTMQKQFLWIPYYRSDNAGDCQTRVGCIANLTNNFNYVILQPGYYFYPELGVTNVNLVQKCVGQQMCYLTNGIIVGGKKTSSTVIGAEMEIDNSITNAQYLNRYNTYVSALKQFVGTYPVGFYCGAPDECTTAVISKINAFF